METPVALLIILGAISGLSHGDGVLPDGLTAAVGETVKFTTTVTPPETPFLVVTWSFSDVNIITSQTAINITDPAYTDRITLFPTTGSLELRDLTLNDTGDYTVTIISNAGAAQKGNCRLVVQMPISNVVVTTSSTDLVELSGSVSLSCSASGSSPSFLWLNSSSEVTASNRVQLTDGGATLTIVDVTRYDQGPFRCHVSNLVSNDTTDPLSLSISYGPENINLTSPSQEYYVEGSNISLSCSAASRPAAVFYWLLNGDTLSDTGQEFRLVNIQMSQSGNYSCQAFNNKTMRYETSQPSAVTVLAPVSNVKVNASTTDILESSSGSISLSCSASGSSPSFLWLNSSSEVTQSDRVQLTDGGATLTIVNVTRYDQGPFMCHVSNLVSTETSDPVTLSIHFGPENINLTLSPSQEYYDEGSDVSLICSTDSGPAPQVYWFLDGDLLPDTGPELRLTNIHISESGNYSCLAFNNITMRNQTSQSVAVLVLKSEVSNVVITPNTTDLSEPGCSVSLSCSASGSYLSFLWLNGSSEVTASDRVQLTDGGSILSIINVTRYDQGPFVCHVFNNFSNYTSDPVELSISFGPENINLQLSPSQEHYEEGSDIGLSCSADSRPSAQLHWFLNGDLLPDTGPELRLVNIQMSQSGNYSCQAFNNKTMRNQTSQPAVISVLAPVSGVVVASNNTHLFEFSSSVSLSCSSSGSSLSFLWMNGSTEVTQSDRIQLTDGGATLTMINVTRYDQGPFRCNVSNGVTGEISQPVYLFIQYGPDNAAIKGPKSAHVGDFTMLYCSTASVPSATFTWLFNGNPTSFHEAVYVLPSITVSDSGTYTCTAVNAVTGQTRTVTHELTVVDCDCSALVGTATIITAACCLVIATVCGIIVYYVVRRRRVNSIYPAHQKEKLSVKQRHSDIYKISRTSRSDLSTYEA
ncbi:carcinoembryonic antigen-related cell adhesion molecule 5-like [Acanthopagrus latus]|uniref:carcinoembryonic antigen-related cell adhesion molecule 5-like n=1 Tax=Acanthopagrus latus TaxID=8177 RepID=UPI00187C68DD|nr:carcinoembryonic antigen-related cell adhesion molecule 5-like [Acanthopagrus latus]